MFSPLEVMLACWPNYDMWADKTKKAALPLPFLWALREQAIT
jgi:hypothetical protein